jgi:polyhydroxyalkanoate synthesis regulator phasin
MNARERNFIQLYFEVMAENIEEISEQLLETGINAEESRDRVLNLIKQQKAELKIENGKVLKERVLELIKKTDTVNESAADEKHYAIAARKLGALESEDIESIKKDSILLKDIGKLINGGKDDTGKTSR